jgi:predicted dehydrogenase
MSYVNGRSDTQPEAEEIVNFARGRDLVCQVGLQMRYAPTFRYIRDLIAEGFISNLWSTTLTAALHRWGPTIPSDNRYSADAKSGVNLIDIFGGQHLDILCRCLGDYREISATVAYLRIGNPYSGDGKSYSFRGTRSTIGKRHALPMPPLRRFICNAASLASMRSGSKYAEQGGTWS